LFNIPILNATNNVRFVRRTQHQIDFVSTILLGICQKQIKTPSSFLSAFLCDHYDVSKPKYAWILTMRS